MQLEQLRWSESDPWASTALDDAQLVFCFGSNQALADSRCFAELRTRYPKAYIAGCSTAGEISCVGRKMVLKQCVEEEVEAVREVMGEGVVMTGFYSYGEIAPLVQDAKCELHNQTMTITTFTEI